MTFAEFDLLQVDAGKLELLSGELLRVPPAPARHTIVTNDLFFELHRAMEHIAAVPQMRVHHQMGYCLSRTPDTWLKPDVSIPHLNQRTEKNAPEEDDCFYVGAPLIAFELVSSPERPPKLRERIDEYLAHGSAEVWALYRSERRALVYRKLCEPRIETTSVHSNLLPGIEIPFDKFFR